MIRFFTTDSDSMDSSKFEPIYGLPKRALAEWLSRNPTLKAEYEKELLARSNRAARQARLRSRKQQFSLCTYVSRAVRTLGLFARKVLATVTPRMSGGRRHSRHRHGPCAGSYTRRAPYHYMRGRAKESGVG